jgi:hypothetical protein
MAIRMLPTTDTEVDLVFSADPDVDAPFTGWGPKADAKAGPGADVVTVRPLNRDERAACKDAGLRIGEIGAYRQEFRRCSNGVVAVGGERDAVQAWLRGCPDGIQFALGLYIRDITNGDDPAPGQVGVIGLAPGAE